MTTAQIIEVIVGAGGVGGLVKAVQTATRVAVAVEDMRDDIKAIVDAQKQTTDKVADHEVRLAKGGL